MCLLNSPFPSPPNIGCFGKLALSRRTQFFPFLRKMRNSVGSSTVPQIVPTFDVLNQQGSLPRTKRNHTVLLFGSCSFLLLLFFNCPPFFFSATQCDPYSKCFFDYDDSLLQARSVIVSFLPPPAWNYQGPNPGLPCGTGSTSLVYLLLQREFPLSDTMPGRQGLPPPAFSSKIFTPLRSQPSGIPLGNSDALRHEYFPLFFLRKMIHALLRRTFHRFNILVESFQGLLISLSSSHPFSGLADGPPNLFLPSFLPNVVSFPLHTLSEPLFSFS